MVVISGVMFFQRHFSRLAEEVEICLTEIGRPTRFESDMVYFVLKMKTCEHDLEFIFVDKLQVYLEIISFKKLRLPRIQSECFQ